MVADWLNVEVWWRTS